MTNSPSYQPVSEILDRIRAQLADETHDDIHLLVAIFTDLKHLNTNRLSPYDASYWLIQKPTEREMRVEKLAIGIGFKRGLRLGFIIGFAICAFVALTILYS
jgi:hypothetical protein